jgi:hypothetical protein
MGRRRTGLVVLVVALAVAVTVSNLNPKHIAGMATVTPPPPPPAVGDCALGPFSTAMDMTSTQQSSQPQPVYPHPPTGSCHHTVYGQITAVITNPARASDAVDGDGQDRNYARCPGNAAYEDLPAGSDTGTAYGHWHVQLATNTVLISPTPRQVAIGQHWVACVIAASQAPSVGVSVSQIDQALGFPTPVGRWRHSRQVAGAVGICLLTSSSSSDARDCSITHAAESFGYTTGPFTPELAATCRALIGDLTGMTDPTAGGRLRVEVLSYNANGDLVTSTQQRKATDTSQACMVNGDGRSYLKGSLLALGSHAVPFG